MEFKKNVFIIGSKGIPAKYGGFETFVENLTLKRQNNNIQNYVVLLKSTILKMQLYTY